MLNKCNYKTSFLVTLFRNESAEIFVVCQGFVAPDRLDPKFTDPKYVFEEVGSDTKNAVNLLHSAKIKKYVCV